MCIFTPCLCLVFCERQQNARSCLRRLSDCFGSLGGDENYGTFDESQSIRQSDKDFGHGGFLWRHGARLA